MTGHRLPAALPLTLVQTEATVGTARAPRAGPAALRLPSARVLWPAPAPPRACFAPRPRHACLPWCARAHPAARTLSTLAPPCPVAHRLWAASSPPARWLAWLGGRLRRELGSSEAAPTSSKWAPGAQLPGTTTRVLTPAGTQPARGCLAQRQWWALPPGCAARI